MEDEINAEEAELSEREQGFTTNQVIFFIMNSHSAEAAYYVLQQFNFVAKIF